MKNKVGTKLTKELMKEMWEEAKVNAFHERGRDLLDDKACDVYYERLLEAEEREASEEELFAIDSKDVTLPLGDYVSHYVGCAGVGAVLQAFHYWLTAAMFYGQ